MKTLEQIQEYVSEKVVMAAHRTDNLVEAQERERSKGTGTWITPDLYSLPLTLARVLHALQIEGDYFFGLDEISIITGGVNTGGNKMFSYEKACSWKLLNEDGTDCVFSMQEEATQRAIYKLLGGEE